MINNKQDRQGVRTPADLEQKYSWKKNFSELHEIAEGAQKTAEGAKKDVVNLDNKLNQEEIFNRLTNNGELQGLYRDEDGNIYINADYIQSGKFTSTAEVFFEPSTEEVDLIMKYCVGEATIPADKIPLYDFNNDGTITIYDAMLAMWAAQGIQSLADWSGAQKTEVTLTIDPENTNKPIMFTGTNMWGRTFERSFGWDDAFIKSTEGGNMYRLNGGEKEWLNPPFQAGTEYRTTERYNSKVVYKKLDSETGHIMWRTEDETEWHAEGVEPVTYALSKEGNIITLVGSDGSSSSVADTSATGGGDSVTYELVKNGSTISLAGSDGTYSEVEDDNTTYSVATESSAGLMSATDKVLLKQVNNNVDALQSTVDDLDQNRGKDGSGNDIVETYATKDELSGKADSSHTHAVTDVNGLQSTINGINNSINTLQNTVDDIDQSRGNYATKEDLEGKSDTGHSHAITDVSGLKSKLDGVDGSITNLTTATDNLQLQLDDIAQNGGKATEDGDGNNIVETYATKAELNGVTSDVQTQLNGKATRISLSGQCQKTDYSLSVIALCYAPTTASTNNGSYTVGRISVVRSNNLSTPLFVDIAMGAAHGAIGRVRTRYTRTDFAVFEPCTFKYNGVLYGGVKFNPSAQSHGYVEFTGTTTFPIFALDIYNTSSKAILNEEVYNSLSSSTVIVSHDLYLGDNAFITSANIGSQSVASSTKATQDGNGNTISTYYMKRGTYERIQGTSSAYKDLNSYTTAGFYNVKTAYVSNCPSGIGIDAVLLVYPWDSSGYECQEITESAACTTSRRWIRHKTGSTWTAWVEMVTSQNIGSFVSSGGGTVVDITSAVSVSGSNGDNTITKAVDTGSSVLILFDGEQEFADINLTVPSYLQSKMCVSAFLYGTSGANNLTAYDNTYGTELGSLYSTFSGYGASLEIKYV